MISEADVITFTTHLVSLLFVYYAFLSIRLVSPSPPVRTAAAETSGPVFGAVPKAGGAPAGGD